jgi:hypothetical protein
VVSGNGDQDGVLIDDREAQRERIPRRGLDEPLAKKLVRPELADPANTGLTVVRTYEDQATNLDAALEQSTVEAQELIVRRVVVEMDEEQAAVGVSEQIRVAAPVQGPIEVHTRHSVAGSSGKQPDEKGEDEEARRSKRDRWARDLE